MADYDDRRNLIFVCDGTLSSQRPGEETNALLLYRTIEAAGVSARQHFHYDAGIQSRSWKRLVVAATGAGINGSIRRGYGWLASRYRPGDRIFLFGYSRGAYAVRSLAGMIGGVGLLRPQYATERNVRLAFRHYQGERTSRAGRIFRARRCHDEAPIEMVGVWDTVCALGLPYPFLTRLHPATTEFHDHRLAHHIRHGYHALAIDEDRPAYAPILWEKNGGWEGRLEQVWFPGCHADVGGEVRKLREARGLSNIPLNWMLRHAARHGAILPEGWEERFPEDPAAPAVGNWRGHGRLFLVRRPRHVGRAAGETLHLSIRDRQRLIPGYEPRALRATLGSGQPASA